MPSCIRPILPKYIAADPRLRSVHPSTARESKWRYIIKKVNLRELYPDVYKTDHFVEVTEDVLETIRSAERAEAAYDRRMYRYKAHYSLDCDNGIENAILMKPQTPEMLLEEKQLREQLYAAVMALPEKQAKRIYACLLYTSQPCSGKGHYSERTMGRYRKLCG